MAQKRAPKSEFPVSNEFIAWAESLAGLLTKVDTTFGGVSEMLECAQWDKAKTAHAIDMVTKLTIQIQKIHMEMINHEDGRMY